MYMWDDHGSIDLISIIDTVALCFVTDISSDEM